MNEENTKKLKEDFPEMFGKLDKYGFEIDDGWYEIVYNLTECIYDYYKLHAPNMFPVVVQVKQKFGGLRYYVDTNEKDYNECLKDMIWFVEQLSFKTCEKCGSKGKLRDDRFGFKTLCDKCDGETK